MPINFTPNDPDAGAPANVAINPSPSRNANQVRFTVTGLPPEAAYQPGSMNFVAWQCREAAFRTLDVFEQVCPPLAGWEGKASRKTMPAIANEGVDLNAYYNRNSISFFEAAVGARTVYSGESTDVVAHEAGHAILDAIRPDFWDTFMLEVDAFHEGFGDCIAIMLALSDQATRVAVLGMGGPASRNFVESTSEQLSAAIRHALGPNHNAAAPRRAFNQFQWALPQSLPTNGPPGVLIGESHSLGQIVSGIYYNLIVAFFAAGPNSQAGLWAACQNATRLIVEATRLTPIAPRFFESWGRTMLAHDHAKSNGANSAIIKAAFAAHGIPISAVNFLTPQVQLATKKAKKKTKAKKGQAKVALTEGARGKIREVMRLDPGTRLSVKMLDLSDEPVAEVATKLTVDLTGLSERLTNVVAHVPRPVLVGESGGTQAMLGAFPAAMLYSSEVRDYVANLVLLGAIAFQGEADPDPAPPAPVPAGASIVAKPDVKTHAVTLENGTPTLRRVSFACRCVR